MTGVEVTADDNTSVSNTFLDEHIYDGNSSNAHNHDVNHYHLQSLFEKSVEVINTAAGFIILFAVVFAALNLILALINCCTGSEIKIINPLHQMKPETVYQQSNPLQFSLFNSNFV